MCQEHNSAEANLQKLTVLQIYFLRDFSTHCPSARTPRSAGIHGALQQVTAPNPRDGTVTPPLPHTQGSPGRAGCYEHGSLRPGAPISAAPGTAPHRPAWTRPRPSCRYRCPQRCGCSPSLLSSHLFQEGHPRPVALPLVEPGDGHGGGPGGRVGAGLAERRRRPGSPGCGHRPPATRHPPPPGAPPPLRAAANQRPWPHAHLHASGRRREPGGGAWAGGAAVAGCGGCVAAAAEGRVVSFWKVLGGRSPPCEPSWVVTVEAVLTKGGGLRRACGVGEGEPGKPPCTAGTPGEGTVPPQSTPGLRQGETRAATTELLWV